MLTEQAAQINVKAERLTGLVLRAAMRHFSYQLRTGAHQQSSIVHGEQSLKDLNAQNRQLNSTAFDSQDIENVRQELNRYEVDFHVMRKEDGTFRLFFKAQDIDRVNMAIENCVKNFDRAAGRKPMEEQLDGAIQEAQERNAANEAKKALEKTVEKAMQKEVTL